MIKGHAGAQGMIIGMAIVSTIMPTVWVSISQALSICAELMIAYAILATARQP